MHLFYIIHVKQLKYFIIIMGQTKDFFGTPIKIGDVVALTDPESSRKTFITGVIKEITQNGIWVLVEIPYPWFNEEEEISEDNHPYYLYKKKASGVIYSPLNKD